MLKEIEALGANRLLNTSVEDLVRYFADKHRIEPPTLVENTERVSTSEIQVPSGFQSNRGIDLDGLDSVSGMFVSMDISFVGDGSFFQTRPSSFTSSHPTAKIGDGIITITHATPYPKADEIKRELERQLSLVRHYLEAVQRDIDRFNTELDDEARTTINGRRARLLEQAGIVAQLGYPLKERTDAPRTYAAPEVRRKINAQLPVASTAPYIPEPALPDPEYEHILRIITDMGQVLERSPSAFRTMGEEDLRSHFLVQLNGHYEGQATGETFNRHGKTDILIRVGGRNIFIAECKFWHGPKSLTDAIDQLLSYSVWRDTKLAIMLFNRGFQTSTVLEKIPTVVREHKSFKREHAAKPGEFRAILGHPDDTNRELILTVLTFDVP
ncbi:MAG TPA: hypothetical protein VFR81_17605 [Longimicrobium sp.]|nr:hypothetical protein [Longimicrobium sp.]